MVRKNISLASKVVFEILAQIDSGDIVSDNKELPSEAELSRLFDVSRATVREALAKLELGGAIVRRHGVGTYVSPMVSGHFGSVRNWLDETPNFLDFIRSNTFQANCTLLDIRVIPADKLSAPLEITPQTSVIFIERVFRADSLPVIHSENYVPFNLITSQNHQTALSSYNCKETVYEFLQQRCHCKTYNQKSEVRATPASKKLAKILHCSPGDPLLSMEEVGYGAKMEPLFYGLNHFRGETVSFVEMRHPVVCLRKSE